MLKIKTWAWSIGLVFMQAFAVFVVRDFFVPSSVQTRHLLEIFLPGFHWLTFGHFLLGLVESFFWGVYVAAFFVSMHNYFYAAHHPRRPGHEQHRMAA